MNGNLTNDEKPDRFALGHGHRRDAVYDRPPADRRRTGHAGAAAGAAKSAP
ncbi:hypothetical protein ACFTXM_34235 [Streptomyces sp. NPDC056930]|uniref:hypothetical protein n=1 Tax=Streptomyces TaxID=1883 RepID=UPI0036450251